MPWLTGKSPVEIVNKFGKDFTGKTGIKPPVFKIFTGLSINEESILKSSFLKFSIHITNKLFAANENSTDIMKIIILNIIKGFIEICKK